MKKAILATKVGMTQIFHGFLCGCDYVDQSLVGSLLKLLTGIFVLVSSS